MCIKYIQTFHYILFARTLSSNLKDMIFLNNLAKIEFHRKFIRNF